jgi:hypothetical protein
LHSLSSVFSYLIINFIILFSFIRPVTYMHTIFLFKLTLLYLNL